MASNIDPTFPADGVPVPKATARANWTAAKDEIEELQAAVAVLDGGGAGYVVPNTGDTADEFEAAMAGLGGAYNTVIARGSYTFTRTMTWNIPDGAVLDFRGADFFVGFTNDSATLVTINGGAGFIATRTLTADAPHHDDLVTLNSTADIQEGDIIHFQSQEWFDKGWNGKRSFEPNRVRAVDSGANQVYLDAPLLTDFTEAGHQADGGTGFPTVDIYRPSKHVRMFGGTWHLDKKVMRGLLIQHFSDLDTDGVVVLDAARYGMSLTLCAADQHRNVRIERAGHIPEVAEGYWGYGIMHTHCCFSRVVDSYGARSWHSFEAADGQRDVTYVNCEAFQEDSGFSTHENCISSRYVNCRVHGATNAMAIHVRSRYIEVEGCYFNILSGHTIAATPVVWDIVVRNCTFDGKSLLNRMRTETPLHATAVANRRVIVTGNTFRGGRLIFETSKNVEFSNNYVELSPESWFELNVPDGGTGVVSGNTFRGQSNINAAYLLFGGSASGQIAFTHNNWHGEGEEVGDTARIDSAVALYVEDNTFDLGTIRHGFWWNTTTGVLRSFCRNTIRPEPESFVLRALSGTTVTVDRFVGNVGFFAEAKKAGGGGTITITREFFNVWSDSP